MQTQGTATARLQLGGHKGKTEPRWAVVDAADLAWLSQWRWSFMRGYGYRPIRVDGRKTTLLLHRAILGLEPGDPRQGDHRNRNRLDNRRSNLRIVTGPQNWQNMPSKGRTSRYRGVSWCKRDGKWLAQATYGGKNHNLGRYVTEEDAAAVALAARKEHMPWALD